MGTDPYFKGGVIFNLEDNEDSFGLINISDSWKTISSIQINIGDSWKEVSLIQINIADSWKDLIQ